MTRKIQKIMGLTHVEATILNPGNPRKSKKLSLLVDSGVVYSVVPKTVLSQLGVKPHSTKTFTLADGSEIKRKLGDAVFKLDGLQSASPVIYGEKGDSTLLGTVSLEALGLLLDPIRRELRPLPMVFRLSPIAFESIIFADKSAATAGLNDSNGFYLP
jgi:aspartyl protease family protein